MNNQMAGSVKDPSNAALLLSAIAEVDGRDFTELGARMFAAALDDMTLGEAMAIASDWLGRPHEYSRIMPYDINAAYRERTESQSPTWSDYWHKDLKDLTPGEWQKWKMIDPTGQYKAWRTLQRSKGGSDDDPNAPLYIAGPKREWSPPGHHFIGNLEISDIIGKESK